MDDLVEMIEIWRPVEEGGQIVRMVEGRSQPMELCALLVGGVPIRLADGYALERTQITKEESVRALASAPKSK